MMRNKTSVNDFTEHETDQDRRAYYRLECAAELELKPCAPNQSDDACTDLTQYFDIDETFSLQTKLLELDYEASHLLHQISEQDKSLGHFLRLVNEKINTIAHIVSQSRPESTAERQQINLSEGGLSAAYPEAFPQGSLVALKLNLLPDQLGVLLMCRVTHCARRDDGSYQLNLAFADLSHPDTQIIARYIAREQRRQLAATRHPKHKKQDTDAP